MCVTVRAWAAACGVAPFAWVLAAECEDFAVCDAAVECEALALCDPLAERASPAGWVVAREADGAPPDWALEPEEDPEPVVEPGRCSATNHTSANSATAARTAWKGRDN